MIPLYYDRADRERGYIEAVDRFGTPRKFQILSLSIATVMAPPGRFQSHADLAKVAPWPSSTMCTTARARPARACSPNS